MATKYSERVLQVACKTLSRDDRSTIPEYYLDELAAWLSAHPDEDNFLIDTAETPPVVTCLDCFTDFQLAPGAGQRVGLRSFEQHTSTPRHIERVHERTPPLDNADERDDAVSLASARSGLSPVPTTPEMTYHPMDDSEASPFVFNQDSQPWNRAAGKKRASSSPEGLGPLPVDDEPDYKRPKYETQNDYGLDFDEDISMLSFPDGFWDPVIPSNVDPQFTRPEIKKKRTSAVLAALDSDPLFGIKPEPVDDYKLPGPSSRAPGFAQTPPIAKRNSTLMQALDAQFGVKPEPMDVYPAFPPVAGPSRAAKQEPVQPFPMTRVSAQPYPSMLHNVQAMMKNVKPEWPNPYPQPPAAFPHAAAPPLPTHAAFPVMPGMPGALPMPVYSLPGAAAGAADVMYGHEFRLNPDQGPPLPIDMAGPGQAAALNDFFTSGTEDLAETATVQDALKKLKLADINHKLPGMDLTLLPHQAIGVAWMNSLEMDAKKRGGILADDMGLGKTVQMIATMCLNQPPEDAVVEDNEEWSRSTLIVVPGSLLEQWRSEIENKTLPETFSVFVHHGDKRLKRKKDVRKYDIVITTYGTLNSEFEKLVREKGKKAHDYIDDETRRTGPLAKTRWWRVVLDEAQFIRNRLTVASINTASLEARHRWCLTGTPVTNTLTDLYPLIRFAKLSPWNAFEDFNSYIGKVQVRNPNVASNRAQAILKPILLRRNKNSTVDGKPILELGPKTITIHKLDFSPREREIYDALEKRQQEKLNRILERGRLAKEYHFILVMILRLRQAANHTQLISYAANEFALDANRAADDRQSDDPDEELERATRLLGAELVSKLKEKFLKRAKDGLANKDEDEPGDLECTICLEPFAGNARITKCGHEFCADCITDVFETAPVRAPGVDIDPEAEQADAAGHRPCPICRNTLKRELVFNTIAFEPSPEEVDKLQDKDGEDLSDEEAEFLKINAKRDLKGKGKAKANLVNGIDIAGLDEGKNFRPSTKMVKMVQLLKECRDNAEDGRVEKTILYSQWTSMIDLVEILLRREGLKSIRYDGQMTRGARDKAITTFKSRNGPDILIISLKCGGVGLNLTEASRVISLDLAWNSATENQAFDRVHRMGQQRPVFVERLVVKDTIEDRILTLQEKKQGLSDAALGEGGGRKLPKMNARELKQLFGLHH
ncbi:hypothetical protein AURDEDRAFT_113300 [Auricularia subglabra TFB-10046 SS5]|nr:hypothetical protein AURDEDRAFT_113300 [Auricularia subglabra TFB-10046 SS5]